MIIDLIKDLVGKSSELKVIAGDNIGEHTFIEFVPYKQMSPYIVLHHINSTPKSDLNDFIRDIIQIDIYDDAIKNQDNTRDIRRCLNIGTMLRQMLHHGNVTDKTQYIWSDELYNYQVYKGNMSGGRFIADPVTQKMKYTLTYDIEYIIQDIPKIPPTANFSHVPTSGNSPLYVNFTNASLDFDRLEWDFGAGQGTSDNLNPSHTYTTAGTYTITLRAYNKDLVDTMTKTITVTAPPPPGITIHAACISFPSSASTNQGTLRVTGLGTGFPRTEPGTTNANNYHYATRFYDATNTGFETSINYNRSPSIPGAGVGAIYVLKNANPENMPKSNRTPLPAVLATYFRGGTGKPPATIAEDGYRHALSGTLVASNSQGSANFIPTTDIRLNSLGFTLNPGDELWIVGVVYT